MLFVHSASLRSDPLFRWIIFFILASFFPSKDPHWLSQVHGAIGTLDNATALRLLHYPPLPDKYNIKPGQVRCGEHSDYGSITLLFQDEIGGLEV